MSWPLPTHDSFGARFARLRHPGFSWCLRCGYPWPMLEKHLTKYSETRGCFPLCEGCWTLLGSPGARIEYYRMMVDEWGWLSGSAVDMETLADIAREVANGG